MTRFIQSFKDAFRGFRYAFKNEQNFRIQTAAAVLVIIGAVYFPLRSWEVILVILMLTLVLTMELLNTALEHLSDLLKPRLHHYVYIVKNVMSAAVLLASAGAAIIGFIIFLPHFINLFR